MILPIKKVIFKNSVPFTNCKSKVNHTQTGSSNSADVVMPVYNLFNEI